MITPFSPIERQMRAMFPPETHPNRVLERAVEARLAPDAAVLDIGCGRTAPNLVDLKGRAATLYGIDVIDFTVEDPDLRLFTNDVTDMRDIHDSSIDVAYSRAVMEHLPDPEGAYRELARVLKPGGCYIFITPSIYDYGSIIAAMVPNRLHPKIVNMVEGREEEDVFPTEYKSNSLGRVRRQVADAGLELTEGRYIGQYPSYLMFNRALFWAGSMYQKLIEKAAFTQPLQGWIFAVVSRPGAAN